jgi:hypothetical protein
MQIMENQLKKLIDGFIICSRSVYRASFQRATFTTVTTSNGTRDVFITDVIRIDQICNKFHFHRNNISEYTAGIIYKNRRTHSKGYTL